MTKREVSMSPGPPISVQGIPASAVRLWPDQVFEPVAEHQQRIERPASSKSEL
jgi:hypothetical protein